jgi:hypothetical protein
VTPNPVFYIDELEHELPPSKATIVKRKMKLITNTNNPLIECIWEEANAQNGIEF